MATKTRQSEAHSPTQPTCKYCEQPIMPGPEFVFEPKTHMHRRCFHSDVHQDWIISRTHEIWIEAFDELCCGLPHPRDALRELFEKFRKPGTTIHEYLGCLSRALELIKRSPLSDDNRSTLTEKVNGLRGQIRRLTTNRAD